MIVKRTGPWLLGTPFKGQALVSLAKQPETELEHNEPQPQVLMQFGQITTIERCSISLVAVT
jgi:hypothetical protein